MTKEIHYVLTIMVLFGLFGCIGLSTNGHSFPKAFENSNMSSVFNNRTGLVYWIEGEELESFQQSKNLVLERLYTHYPINTGIEYIYRTLNQKGFTCDKKAILRCSISATVHIYDEYIFTKKCSEIIRTTFQLEFIGGDQLEEIMVYRRNENNNC